MSQENKKRMFWGLFSLAVFYMVGVLGLFSLSSVSYGAYADRVAIEMDIYNCATTNPGSYDCSGPDDDPTDEEEDDYYDCIGAVWDTLPTSCEDPALKVF